MTNQVSIYVHFIAAVLVFLLKFRLLMIYNVNVLALHGLQEKKRNNKVTLTNSWTCDVPFSVYSHITSSCVGCEKPITISPVCLSTGCTGNTSYTQYTRPQYRLYFMLHLENRVYTRNGDDEYMHHSFVLQFQYRNWLYICHIVYLYQMSIG